MLQDLEHRSAGRTVRALDVFVGLFFQDVAAASAQRAATFRDPLDHGVSAVDFAKDGIGADLDILE